MTPPTPLAAATAYLTRRGWQPIPAPVGQKRPVLPDWQHLRTAPADLPRYFDGAGNVGLLLGEPSGWLADIDLDASEAAAVAAAFLPPTEAVSGRTTRPRTHFWYVAEVAATRQFVDPSDGAMLVELRSTNGQTLVAPSVHPDGSRYVWNERGRPARVGARDLLQAVSRVASAALLARHWPGQGSRHRFALALAGHLLRGGLDAATARLIVEQAATAAGDAEVTDRARAVDDTATKLALGQAVTGLPTLNDFLDAKVIAKLGQWLSLKRPAEPHAPTPARSSGPAVERTRRGVAVRLADVESTPLTWVWPGRIPAGKLTILTGSPGEGKSLIGLDLCARVSRGWPMPGDENGLSEPAGVLLLVGEDDLGDTVRPRLEACGADLSRIVALEAVQVVEHADGDERVSEHGVTIADIDVIEAQVRAVDAKLIIVDPLTAFFPAGRDSHRDTDTRTALKPLIDMAARVGAAVLAVKHTNKSTSAATPLHRDGGSVAFVAAARSALLAARDPSDETGSRRALAMLKGNLAREAATLSYSVTERGGVPAIAWGGPVTTTAAQLLAAPTGEERGVRAEAVEFLRALLEDGPRPAKDVTAAARDAGISKSTLDRARWDLHVIAEKSGMAGGWTWRLPSPEDPQPARRSSPNTEDPQPQDVRIFGRFEDLRDNGRAHDTPLEAPRALRRSSPPAEDPQLLDVRIFGEVEDLRADTLPSAAPDGSVVGCGVTGCTTRIETTDGGGGGWCAVHRRRGEATDAAAVLGWPRFKTGPHEGLVGPGPWAWRVWLTTATEADVARVLRLLGVDGDA